MNFDTSKIDEWTVEMCRDWLRDKSWKKIPTWRGFQYLRIGTANQQEHDPIPATLDCAAMLPEGVVCSTIEIDGDNTVALCSMEDRSRLDARARGEQSELLARFRLRCKVESLTVRAEG